MRVGPHVMLALTRGSRQRKAYERWITTVQPPVVKFCRQGLDPAILDWTRSQGSKVVARWVDIELMRSGAENGRIARRVLAELTPFAAHLDYLEFGNEELQGKDNPAEWDDLMAACLTFMQQLDEANRAAGRAGPKACIANVSVGCPEIARWSRPSTVEVARYAAAHGHVWGLHEYYKPNPWAGLLVKGSSGTAAERALWMGATPPAGWLMLRCVQVRDIMRKNGIPGFRFIITESGRDNVPDMPGEGGGFRDEPATPDGDFADFMFQYGGHLSRIEECLGWVDFGFNHWEGWGQFDLADAPEMFERIMLTQLRLPRGAALPPPTQPPTTPPGGSMNALEEAIVREATNEHGRRGLPYTPKHALITAAKIAPGQLLPTTDEFPIDHDGKRYRGQRFQVSDTGDVVILYCVDGQWSRVSRIDVRPKA